MPDEAPLATVRQRLRSIGLNPASLPLAVDRDARLARAPTPWDCFPDSRTGKMDAETCALATALLDRNVALETGARVRRLVSDDRGRIAAVEYEQHGTVKRLSPGIVILSAGAANSAALLLESGIANRSGAVGRHFMNHNSTAMVAVSPCSGTMPSIRRPSA